MVDDSSLTFPQSFTIGDFYLIISSSYGPIRQLKREKKKFLARHFPYTGVTRRIHHLYGPGFTYQHYPNEKCICNYSFKY